MHIHIFIPCFIDQIYPQTGMNMVHVLEKAGCKVHYNPNQTCCGQVAFNSGFWDEARVVAKKFIDDFRDAEYIVCPSASCTGMVRNYYRDLFEDTQPKNPADGLTKRIYEFTEFLVKIVKVIDYGAELNGIATYHDSCSALRECQIKVEPRLLLEKVKGLQLVEMKNNDECCGFGGTFSIKFEPISVVMAKQKVENALAANANYIISTDASCLMNLEGYIRKQKLPIKALHIADVLAGC
ncbi:MAG: (Fe-S)-binding protein [Bacteroidetes bacterium]|nr:(Fe-S)-binding protein [Bacteroidota bacterium]